MQSTQLIKKNYQKEFLKLNNNLNDLKVVKISIYLTGKNI